VHAEAAQRNLKTIDATCPLVTKVHNEAKRFAKDGYKIILIGHEGHEEVEGTMGEAPDNMVLVDGLDQVEKLEVKEGEKIAWLSQTTLSVDETLETVHALKRKLPILMDPPSDDICYATQNRQAAVKNIAPQVDILIVVGSSNSSNSVRLVDVALEAGVKKSFRVDSRDELKNEWFEGAKSVGLTSGASVPEELVDGVLAWLSENGYGDVEEVETIEEHITFSLPVEIRKDLKAAGKA
jgi:4-hydroxy-3-methylbut-2-enyl diphosphate reductase